MITENRHNEFGCLMAMVEPTRGPHIIKFGKTVIPSQILYIDPNDSTYGYDDEPHITTKYGYSPDLTRANLATILQGIKPFVVKLTGLTQFQNEKYDVVKFDVENNEILSEIRRRCDCYKNEERLSNDYLTGVPDVNTDVLIDVGYGQHMLTGFRWTLG